MQASRPRSAPSPRSVLVAGGGLAGACVAWALAEAGVSVTLVADGAGASTAAAAGLANPRMGPRAARAWRADEALDALDRVSKASGGHVRHHPAVRPASDARQAERWATADLPNWTTPDEAAERWPWLVAPHGALVVPDARVADVPALVAGLIAASGAEVVAGSVAGWRVTAGGVEVRLADGPARTADALVLCPGAEPLPQGAPLPLHRVKGQTVRVARPEALPHDAPSVAGRRYVVPAADGSLVVGASHEHAFVDSCPSDAVTRRLLGEAAATVPMLSGARVLGATAGVRAHVPDAVRPGRLPLVGPLAGAARVWVVAGLGGRGLLTAPLVGTMLAEALVHGAALPPDVSTAGVRAWDDGGPADG